LVGLVRSDDETSVDVNIPRAAMTPIRLAQAADVDTIRGLVRDAYAIYVLVLQTDNAPQLRDE
jgi:hypothetical protein